MSDRTYIATTVLLVLVTASFYCGVSGQSWCRRIQESNPNAPTGAYIVRSKSGQSCEVWCEMGLCGGGYTFLTPQFMNCVTNGDIESPHYNYTSVLFIPRLTSSIPVYSCLEQLPEYSHIPITVQLNSSTGFTTPPNVNVIGAPYLFIGFLPSQLAVEAGEEGELGIQSNGQNLTYSNYGQNLTHSHSNCNETSDSYLALFPNFHEISPAPVAPRVKSYVNTTLCAALRKSSLPIPSGRTPPPENFMFFDFNVGGQCGCHYETNPATRVQTGIISAMVGFK
jgi:hypothetical protein